MGNPGQNQRPHQQHSVQHHLIERRGVALGRTVMLSPGERGSVGAAFSPVRYPTCIHHVYRVYLPFLGNAFSPAVQTVLPRPPGKRPWRTNHTKQLTRVWYSSVANEIIQDYGISIILCIVLMLGPGSSVGWWTD